MKPLSFIFWLIFATVFFFIFAWDMEHDRDIWTWVALYNAINGYMIILFGYIENVGKKYK